MAVAWANRNLSGSAMRNSRMRSQSSVDRLMPLSFVLMLELPNVRSRLMRVASRTRRLSIMRDPSRMIRSMLVSGVMGFIVTVREIS